MLIDHAWQMPVKGGSLMAYVAWKIIKGHGPYAYLRQSVWRDGQSRHRPPGLPRPLGWRQWRPGRRFRCHSRRAVIAPEARRCLPEFSRRSCAG